jgi:hypothetical protein
LDEDTFYKFSWSSKYIICNFSSHSLQGMTISSCGVPRHNSVGNCNYVTVRSVQYWPFVQYIIHSMYMLQEFFICISVVYSWCLLCCMHPVHYKP